MDKPFIFQITGYQNSGKTTYVNKLLSQLAMQNLKVVTLKHHGHGGKPNIVEEADSALHVASGATASLVEGGGRLLLQTETIAWTLEEKIHLLTGLNPDVILIEGHKYESYPKLVLLRKSTDFHLLNKLENIVAVIYQDQKPAETFDSTPIFQRNDPSSINWVSDYIISQVTKV
jgi:molybdopterin-guanine dinucleotide biosynthesis protein B